MVELIDKQDAINICDKYSGYMPRNVAQRVWEEMKELPPVQPEITQDQLEEYCKKRCLTVVTDDLYYKLTSGSKDTATLATMSSAVSPYNDDYTKFIEDLLSYEERNDMFNLTTRERAEFQAYVRERMEL